jgi:protein-tyrosine phosphatase
MAGMQRHPTRRTGGAPQPEPVRNISQLTDRLWVGGDLPGDYDCARATIHWWHDLGIRRIIDTRVEWSDETLVRSTTPDIRYRHLPQDDRGQRIPVTWFDSIVAAARDGLEDTGGTLVHCHMGINRGPSAAHAILMDEGWDPVTAIDHIRQRRPIAAVAYAEDGLRWWHHRHAVPTDQRWSDRQRLEDWRRANPHDTVRIIRQIRMNDAPWRAS